MWRTIRDEAHTSLIPILLIPLGHYCVDQG